MDSLLRPRDYLLSNGPLKRLLVWVGARSYAICLIHIPAFYLSRELCFRLGWDASERPLSLLAISLVLIVVLSELNYRFVESPCRDLGSRLVKRLSAARRVATTSGATLMLNFLKKIVSPPSPATEPVAAPPAPAPVDPYMLGLRDAVLSGWFNQETDELFSGFRFPPRTPCSTWGAATAATFISAPCAALASSSPTSTRKRSPGTRERLADTPARELECLVVDCDPLPLADATATRVVSTEVIEHVDDPRQFLAELVRVGQPGALYLLSVPHPTSEDLQKDFAADEYFRKPNHIRVLGEEQFAALVREAGLEILSHSRYGFYWSLWMLLFWEAKVDFGNPDHPLLEHWARTWQALLDSPRGPAIKQALDAVVAKSQVIIARKPAQA